MLDKFNIVMQNRLAQNRIEEERNMWRNIICGEAMRQKRQDDKRIRNPKWNRSQLCTYGDTINFEQGLVHLFVQNQLSHMHPLIFAWWDLQISLNVVIALPFFIHAYAFSETGNLQSTKATIHCDLQLKTM